MGLSEKVKARIKMYLSARSCPSTVGQVRLDNKTAFILRYIEIKAEIENLRERPVVPK